jgi:hypothetical protein
MPIVICEQDVVTDEIVNLQKQLDGKEQTLMVKQTDIRKCILVTGSLQEYLRELGV